MENISDTALSKVKLSRLVSKTLLSVLCPQFYTIGLAQLLTLSSSSNTLQDGYPQSWKLVDYCMYMISVLFTYVNNHTINHISLNRKGRPGHYVKSLTVQDTFQPTPHTSYYGTHCDLLCIRRCATLKLPSLAKLLNTIDWLIYTCASPMTYVQCVQGTVLIEEVGS